MELTLTRQEMPYVRPLYCGTLTKEETAEAVVPDTMPDARRILGVVASPLLRAKEAERGRVTITGVCDAAILYLPEEGEGPERLAVSVPFTLTREIPGLTEEALLTAEVWALSCDARLIHGRKAALRVELAARVAAFQRDTLTTVTGAEGELEQLTCEAEIVLPTAVNERTFSLTDTVSLGKERVGRVLGAQTAFTVADVKNVGAKLVVKGEAITTVLYRNEDILLASRSFHSPFSQIVDLDREGDCVPGNVTVTATGLYVTSGMPTEEGEEGLALEIHAVLQCVATREEKVKYLKDAYSLVCPLQLTKETITLTSTLEPRREELLLSASFPTPQEVESIDAILASPALMEVSTAEEGRAVTCPVNITIFYTARSGELLALSRRSEVETTLREGERPQTLCPEYWSCEFNATPEGLALRMNCVFTAAHEREMQDEMVSAISCEEGCTLDHASRPSLVVCRYRHGESLWEIAKRCLSTEKAILALNGLEGEEPEAGTLLLIPKAQEGKQ
ncbi:MAG: DUF3794 and LysM peptidoglycan-binding domain-containing protein [bacterium]